MDAKLIAESQCLLNQARMIAEAPAAGPVQIGGGHPEGSAPAGAFGFQNDSTLARCWEWIKAAMEHDVDERLAAANRRCAHELQMIRQGVPNRGAETRIEFRERVARDYEGELAAVVARAENSTVTTIRKLREEAGRDARTGRGLPNRGLGGAGR